MFCKGMQTEETLLPLSILVVRISANCNILKIDIIIKIVTVVS